MLKNQKPTRRVVRVLIINKKRKMLLARQATRMQWHLPGGKIKLFENPIFAARREVKEETGLRCFRIRMLHIEFIEHKTENEEVWCYRGYITQNEDPRPDGREIDQLKWLSLKETSQVTLTDTTRHLLQNLALIKLFV
jgi:8-oxo-dGTP pyrophosphatase MutT (NUDIX family)